MSQETPGEKKRRSPERQTPCTACPQRVAGSLLPALPHGDTNKGTNPWECPGHPPAPSSRMASSFHLGCVTDPRFTWGNPRAATRCPGDANPTRAAWQPEGRLRAPFEWHPEQQLRKKKKLKIKNKKKKKQAENKTKPAITPDGRGIGFWLPLWFPPSSPSLLRAECSWLRLANWLCQSSVTQGSCPGEGS